MHLRKLLCVVLLIAARAPVWAQSGNITSNQCVSISVDTNASVVGIQVTGTWTGTLQPQVAIQGQAYVNAQVTPSTSTTAQATITANGIYYANVAGASTFQVCGNTVASGTAVVYLNRSQGVNAGALGGGGSGTSGPVATGLPSSGLLAEYRMTDSGTTTLTDSSGNSNNGTFPGGGANPSRIASGTGNIGLSFTASSHQFITLPTALNSCVTYLFGYNYPTVASTSSAENDLLGQATAQGGGSLYAIGLSDKINTSNGGNEHQHNLIIGGLDYSGGHGATWVMNPGVGTHVLVYASGVLTTSADAFYVDGQAETNYGNQATSGTTINNGTSNWQLGGATTFTGWYQGNMYYFACWNRQLNPSEATQASNVVSTILTQEGVPIQTGSQEIANPTSSSGQDTVVLDGDSIMYGANDITNSLTTWGASMVLTNTPTVTTYVPAWPGVTMLGFNFPNAKFLDNYYTAGASRNVIVQNAGHNDSVSNSAGVEGAMAGFCRARKLVGWTCGIVSEVSNGGTNDSRNAYYRQHWRESSDFFVDWAGDPTIGCDTCNGSFVGPHPNVWQTYSFQQYYTQRAINRITGPKDFTSATVYNSAAAAATTVTAASDGSQIGTTGQSVATYTFGVNPFIVGQLVTCTGITPSGYNTTLMVQTASGTQITGVIPSTGLGAGTVFGSCSAPQAEDAFAIINFGTGNFNIGTACGYTGQRVNIKNINASSSTLTASSVPNESAETFDGSSTLAIASNQVRILESVLSTPSTPQCGWKVIQ